MTRECPHLQAEVQEPTMVMVLPGLGLGFTAGHRPAGARWLWGDSKTGSSPVLLQNPWAPCVLAQTVPGHQADGTGLLGISCLGV